MLINADHSQRVVLVPNRHQWMPSPQPGVERVMLYRQGAEKAIATSIVRYAQASHFPLHEHPGGEEILVLCGTFSEGAEHHGAGWYLRNPPGSSHRPHSDEGATIFVKLGQMRPGENRSVRIDTHAPGAWQHRGGRSVCPLFSDDAEEVMLERLDPGMPLVTAGDRGLELLVLGGELHDAQGHYPRGSWLRLPAGKRPAFVAGGNGATLYVKAGDFAHLAPQE